MKNITQEELQTLEACQSAEDWGQACVTIKKARDGMYPDDWWDKVKQSGLMDRILGRWGKDSSLKLTSLTRPPFKYTTDGKDRQNNG